MPDAKPRRYLIPDSYTAGRKGERTSKAWPHGSMHTRIYVCLPKKHWQFVVEVSECCGTSQSETIRMFVDACMQRSELGESWFPEPDVAEEGR